MISRRNVLKTGAALGCISLGANVSYGMLKDPLVKLGESLNDAIQDLPAASISAAIIKNHHVYWAGNYGYQDIASGTIMTEHSTWRSIGSISKLIVWTAIMQLAESEQLDLDRDVSDYIGFALRSPHYPDSKITVHHLLTHSSSLSSRKLMSAPAPMADSFCDSSDESLADWVQRYLSPEGEGYAPDLIFNDYRPGDDDNISPDPLGVVSGYSNLNAVLGAYIVEKITGKLFDVYCEEEIFNPSGMTQTSWKKEKNFQWITHYEATSSARSAIMQTYTQAMHDKGYVSDSKVNRLKGRGYIEFAHCDYFSPVYPMGLLGTSVRSLLPLLLAYINQGSVNGYQLLKSDTVNRILSHQRRDQNGVDLGLGWFRKWDNHAGYIWGHEGGGPGIVSSAFISAEKGAGVVLFINNFHVNYRLRSQLLTAMKEIAFSS